ncbi:response regulator [bacterium CPR1]|nr:response regulator [bacterium CPR1]
MKGQPRILVVDDESGIRKFLRVSLTAHDYEVKEASSGAEAMAMAPDYRPDLVILDMGLPDMTGLDVIGQLREWSAVPILVLSVLEGEKQKVAALDAGADDYLTKPFGLPELLARVRASLRRSQQLPVEDPVFRHEELLVDLAARRVLSQEREIQLTPTEYEILRQLVLHAGKVLTHRQLLAKVWGPEYGDETHLLRVNVSNLRRKIEPDPVRPRHLVTEAGVGYRLRTG